MNRIDNVKRSNNKKRTRSLSPKDKEEKAEEGSFSNSKMATRSAKKAEEKKKWSSSVHANLSSLPAEVLHHLVLFLDTDSSLALMATCKTIHDKMARTVKSHKFCAQMCWNEGFDKIEQVLMRQYEVEDAATVVVVDQTRSVARMSDLRKNDVLPVVLPVSSSSSSSSSLVAAAIIRKLFLRGLQMRRNVCQGRFKSLRVDLPLGTLQEGPFWHKFTFLPFCSDDFLVVFLRGAFPFRELCRSVFVWRWDRFRNPTFLYSRTDILQMDLLPPMAFHPGELFLHGKHLFLAPTWGPDLIRIHDLSDGNLTVVGRFGLSGDGMQKSQIRDSVQLHKVGEEEEEEVKAMIFYRAKGTTWITPTPLKLFVVSLPSCELLVEMEVPGSLQVRLRNGFDKRNHKMAFCFDSICAGDAEIGQKMLLVDFEEFVKGRGPVAMAMGSEIERGDEVYTYGVLDRNRIVLLHKSGKVTVLRMDLDDGSHVELLVIPSLGKKRAWDEMSTASNGRDVFALMRNFASGGLKVFVYSTSTGDLMYSHRLGEKRFGLELRKFGEKIQVRFDDHFLVVSNPGRVAFWNAKSGKFVSSFPLREEKEVSDRSSGKFLLRKQLAFEFAGHGLVSVSEPKEVDAESRRASADIVLFI